MVVFTCAERCNRKNCLKQRNVQQLKYRGIHNTVLISVARDWCGKEARYLGFNANNTIIHVLYGLFDRKFVFVRTRSLISKHLFVCIFYVCNIHRPEYTGISINLLGLQYHSHLITNYCQSIGDVRVLS